MFVMTSKPLYQPLRADHSHMLASRRSALVELFSHLDLAQVGLRSPLEKAQIVLEQGLVAKDAFEHQEAVGVLVGDELIRRDGFEWVTLDDDYGSEPAVAHPLKMAVVSPLSSVTNRFEDGEVPFDLEGYIREVLDVIRHTEIKDREA